MGSSRLPGKIMMKIGSKTLLEHIFFRLSYLVHNVNIVLATSIEAKDDAVEEYCAFHGWNCFRGSEDNVLERYVKCAREYGFNQIVRLTGDNPFVDIEELDRLISLHQEGDGEYSFSYESLPIGIGAEVFDLRALERSYNHSYLPHHFEHVNEYILENQDQFKICRLSVPISKRRPDIRLTVDTVEDYERACYIIKNSTRDYISTEEAIGLCMQYV
jgi:spore coat polysaccharide biosynthesis protein SpsF